MSSGRKTTIKLEDENIRWNTEIDAQPVHAGRFFFFIKRKDKKLKLYVSHTHTHTKKNEKNIPQ